MEIDYKIVSGKNLELNLFKEYILYVNNDFPVSITTKTNIDDFLKKIQLYGMVSCAYYNNDLIGTIFFYANDKKNNIAFITLVSVKKQFQSCGIGNKLLNNTIDYCYKNNFECIQLYTRSTNNKAIKFYFHHDFYNIDCDRDGDIKLEKKLGGKMNLLITSVGRRSYLVEYFKKELKGIGEVHVSNSSKINPAFSHVEKKVVTPLIYDKNYIPFLLDYCEKNNIKMIISLFDVDLYILALNRKKFEQIGVTLIISEVQFIKTCNDKWLTYKFLKENNFNVPKTFLELDNSLQAIKNKIIKYPVVIKPRWGMGSLSIFIADNDEELKFYYNKVKKEISNSYIKYESQQEFDRSVIIQEKLDGIEYGLDVINDLEGNYINTITKIKISMRSGETDCAKIVYDHSFELIGKKLSSVSKHIANLDVDCFLCGDEIYILEMNARFGGGYPFSYNAGVNLPRAIIKWYSKEKFDNDLLKVNKFMIAHKDIIITEIQD